MRIGHRFVRSAAVVAHVRSGLATALSRLAVALPDALTAAFFISVWLAPFALSDKAVRSAMLIMLVEFILIHATAFLTAFALQAGLPRVKRVLAIAAFGLFYSLFIALFVMIFQERWPILVFAWLLLAKLAGALAPQPPDAVQLGRQQSAWALSVLLYILGVLATVLLPLPRLGMTETAQAQFALPGSGLWIEQPHRVIAFGAFYFGVLAWSKLAGWRGPATASH